MKDKDRMMLDMRRHYEYKNFQDVLEQAKSLTASLSTEDLKYTEDEASSRNYDSDEDQVVQRNMAVRNKFFPDMKVEDLFSEAWRDAG